MFGFLKKKIKESSDKIAEEIEETAEVVNSKDVAEDEKKILEKEEEEIKKGFFKKIFSKKNKENTEEETEEKNNEIKEEQETQTTEKSKDNKKTDKTQHIKKDSKKNVKETLENKDKESDKKEVNTEIEKQETQTTEKPKDNKKEISQQTKKQKHNKKEKKNKENIINPTQTKKNIFKKLGQKISKFQIDDERFEELFWELELALLENNVALEVIEKIKNNLKKELEQTKVTRKSINDIILNNLKNTLESLFDYDTINLIDKIKQKQEPYIILMIGVNGSGKTTTIAKLIKYFQKNNLKTIVSASDTFRAAAIHQLEEHTNKLNTKLIKHDYGADPAAVSYDAIEHAKSKKADVVLIDTAGRLHSNSNLMQELKKIIKVSNPDMKIFVGESITGNDCVEQAKQFQEAVGIDGIILTKADIDEKGGAAISISYVTKKPILFITTGQEYEDIKVFNSKEIIESIFSE
jgi:fused signal recognition particle receptor